MVQEHKPERIVQELVPGKEITIAHLIASPDITLYEKLGLDRRRRLSLPEILLLKRQVLSLDLWTGSAAH